MKKLMAIILAIALVFSLAACGGTKEAATSQGSVSYTVITVDLEGIVTTFEITSDKETVGAALLEHTLIEGADGMYTVVNGMTADYNVDQTYWAFYENDAYANQGMDTTTINPEVTYKLVQSK